MIAAFPEDPLEEGSDTGEPVSLLEPPSELIDELDAESDMDIDPPPPGPLQIVELELPTMVYDRETDEVRTEIRAFHFPYRAQV
jgi:hypothetical protein